MTVRVLVIGSGAREHALLLALRRDPEVDALAVAPGNAGTASIAEQYDVDITSGDEVVKLAKRFEADLVVVGPEVPLVLGVADAVRAADIACFAFALRCFEVSISVPALVVAYATGYAASRRSLPLGGAGITEALLTLALIEVHVGAVAALLSVAAYRVVNFLVPVVPGLIAHSSLAEVMDGDASGSSSKAA